MDLTEGEGGCLKASKTPLQEMERYRTYNLERMLDWLAAYAGSAGQKRGQEPIKRIDRRDKPGPQFPSGLGAARLEALFDHDIKITDSILGRIFLAELPNKNFTWYLNLLLPYLGENASPSESERWYLMADEDERAKTLYKVHEKTIEWAIGRAERLLLERGRKRLVVSDPEQSADDTAEKVRRQRRSTADIYYKLLEECEEEGLSEKLAAGEAMRRACAETGYSEREIRTIREQIGRRMF